MDALAYESITSSNHMFVHQLSQITWEAMTKQYVMPKNIISNCQFWFLEYTIAKGE